jgi:acyl dehydratase
MAVAARIVTDWIGDPGAVLDYGVRFTRPVVVTATGPTELVVAGKVRSIEAEAATAVLDISTSVSGETVLARARVTVRVPRA